MMPIPFIYQNRINNKQTVLIFISDTSISGDVEVKKKLLKLGAKRGFMAPVKTMTGFIFQLYTTSFSYKQKMKKLFKKGIFDGLQVSIYRKILNKDVWDIEIGYSSLQYEE